jgi:ribosomal protein S14
MDLKRYKKRQIILQYLYRKRYLKIYNFYFVLKLIIKNKYIENQFKILAIFLLINFNRINFISYHKNICLMTGHKRSIINFFKLNRLSILNNLNTLILPGVQKTI